MKSLTLYILFFNISLMAGAQLCPGGGTDFSNAVTFDPSWIYGCNTGTSCNGGVHFDNRASCESTTSLDACAPAPSCVTLSNTASDIWFRFYPSATTVTLRSFQNTSFVVGIQAFSGGPACGSLTDIGCAVAPGPSSGVSLTLTGLTIGQLYYYRVFGSSGPVVQRTGLYCFCGTTGVDNFVLPSVLSSFTANNKNELNILVWKLNPGNNITYFEVEKSMDGKNFFTLKRIAALNADNNYTYSEKTVTTTYYRIKLVNTNGQPGYSPTILLKSKSLSGISIVSNKPGKPIELRAEQAVKLAMYNSNGEFISHYSLYSGLNILSTAHLSNGIYLMKNPVNNSGIKIIVLNK